MKIRVWPPPCLYSVVLLNIKNKLDNLVNEQKEPGGRSDQLIFPKPVRPFSTQVYVYMYPSLC